MKKNTFAAFTFFGMTLLGFSSACFADSVTWHPMEKPVRESDTLFLPDLTSRQTITNDGGFLFGHANETSEMTEKNFEFGQGKFGPAVKAKPGGYNLVQYPVDGLVASDEFTIEFWMRSAEPPSVKGGAQFFALSGNNDLLLGFQDGQLNLNVSVPLLKVNKSWRKPAEELHLTDAEWHEIGLTFKAGALHLFVDGKEAATLGGITFTPTISDGTHGTGVHLCGDPHAASTEWISDVRFSRTARIPEQEVALRSLDGTVMVDVTKKTGAVPPAFVGSLHPGGTVEQGQAAFQATRTDKLLNSTPIKRGPPDETHPTAGKSGQFSYDWQVVDREFDWYKVRGIAPYISLDSTPQVLGGAGAPFAGDKLKDTYSASSGFNEIIPNNNADWGQIVSDLVYHVVKERGDKVAWWSVWNEPGAMFKGTMEQYDELYGITVNAVRAVDPQAKVGGPEEAALGNYVNGLFKYAKENNLPLDYVSYHDYSGDLSELDIDRAKIDAAAQANGYPTPFPILLGEYQWSAEALYKSGLARWASGMWTLRSLDAAYLTASMIRELQIGGFGTCIVSHTQYGDPLKGGWASMQLTGPNGEQWAPFNALKGWKQTIKSDILDSQQDLPPGIYALATQDPKSRSLGMALANWGFANRSARTVHVTLNSLAPGDWTLKRYLVDSKHSSPWDAKDDPKADAAANKDLALVETTPLKIAAGQPADIKVELPYWSSTFLSIEPSAPPATSALSH